MIVDISNVYSKALVTGGAGFIGSHIVEELLKQKIYTVCIDNFVGGKESNISKFRDNPLFEFIEADVSNYLAINKHFKNVEVVFHNAASKCTVCRIDPYLDLEVNAKGTFNVLEASRDNGVKKIVHASTGSVYGEGKIFPQTESHPLNPTSFYGVSKLAGEKYCNTFINYYGMDISMLRYFHVYGPRQEFDMKIGGVIPIFINRIKKNLNPIIFGDGSQIRSFTYVKDDVNANFLLSISDKTKGEVYNCASGIKITVNELAEKLLNIIDNDNLSIEYEDWRPGDIKYFEVDNSKIRSLGINFETSFDEGLTSTINWMESHLKSE